MSESITPDGTVNIDPGSPIAGPLPEARSLPTLILGRTGMGKSTLLASMAVADIEAGHGVLVLDPHGDLVEVIQERLSTSARERVAAWDAADPETPIGVNPVEPAPAAWRDVSVAGLIDTFRKLFGEQGFGPRSEHFLRNAAYLLQEQPRAELGDVHRLFLDEEFRRSLLPRLTNPAVRAFWLDEFPSYPSRFRAEALAPLYNKLGALLADQQLARILSGDRVQIRFRESMDHGWPLLVGLSKGRLGSGPAEILGSLLLARLTVAAMSRVEIPLAERRPFSLLVDEAHAFATPVFLSLLSETRKFGLSVTVTLQYLDQMEPVMRKALLGSVGTLVCFRLGVEDAKTLAPEFAGEVTVERLLGLGVAELLVRSTGSESTR